MKLILARVLPVALALLVPSLSFAEESQEKPASTQTAGSSAKRTKAGTKPRKASKPKAAKAKAPKASKSAKLSKKASH